MRSDHLLGLACSAALLALAAPAVSLAQTAAPTTDQGTMNMPPPTPSASSAQSQGVYTSGVATDPSQMTPTQIAALRAGDNTLVTNGPVPDTPANRAKYTPLSNLGRRTPADGH